jgi:hypothetical protein
MEESQRIELCQAFLPVSVFRTVADHSALLSVNWRRAEVSNLYKPFDLAPG